MKEGKRELRKEKKKSHWQIGDEENDTLRQIICLMTMYKG